MQAVKGSGEERASIRRANKCERRATFYNQRLDQYPAHSMAALREVLDFIRAVAEDLDNKSREDLTGRLAQLAEERNVP